MVANSPAAQEARRDQPPKQARRAPQIPLMSGTPGLLGDLFVDAEMARIFDDRGSLQGMLDFEAALARAEVAAGVIPAEALPAIESACRAELYDVAAIGRAATLAGNPAIPLVKALTAQVASNDPEAAKWVHFGATSQDVIDSGHAQQYREAQHLILGRSARLAEALAGLAREHRRTPMIGRTFLQHAVPISFGLKAAQWLDPILSFRDHFRIWGTPSHQLGGAAGTLASLGEKALPVLEAFVKTMPSIGASLTPSHAQRDRLALMASLLGILAGNLGKIALDIALMAQTEVAELAEPEAPGKGGSSAMPHKRNPVLCTLILAASRRAPGLVTTMLASMPQEHERALGGWHAEWLTLQELFCVTGAALSHAVTLIEGLQVFPANMRRNLDLTNGLVMAERVSLALAETIGREAAHHALERASRGCVASGRHLKAVLAGTPELEEALSKLDLDALFDPTTYRGASDTLIDRALARLADERQDMTPHA